jgi:hypothetical protein
MIPELSEETLMQPLYKIKIKFNLHPKRKLSSKRLKEKKEYFFILM